MVGVKIFTPKRQPLTVWTRFSSNTPYKSTDVTRFELWLYWYELFFIPSIQYRVLSDVILNSISGLIRSHFWSHQNVLDVPWERLDCYNDLKKNKWFILSFYFVTTFLPIWLFAERFCWFLIVNLIDSKDKPDQQKTLFQQQSCPLIILLISSILNRCHLQRSTATITSVYGA